MVPRAKVPTTVAPHPPTESLRSFRLLAFVDRWVFGRESAPERVGGWMRRWGGGAFGSLPGGTGCGREVQPREAGGPLVRSALQWSPP